MKKSALKCKTSQATVFENNFSYFLWSQNRNLTIIKEVKVEEEFVAFL